MAKPSENKQAPEDWLWGLLLALAVIVAYLPLGHAGFVWDDEVYVTANPCIVGPLGLKEIWTSSQADICPLTLTLFWLEHALWGLAPVPYHLVNILQHAGSAVVLWRVLRRLLVPGAWLGAALWALHPVQVESVAWIAEMKNTQSGLFFLLAILFFLRWFKDHEVDRGTVLDGNYVLSLLFALMAMTSKASTVVLPVVLCLCLWWLEGKWRWNYLVRVAPFFLLTAVSSVVAVWAVKLRSIGSPMESVRSWPERFITAGDAVWFYLGKLAWPHPLVTVYPRWELDAGNGVSYLPLLAVIVAGAIFWLKRNGWSRPYFFIFAYFLVALFPALGFIDHNFLRYSLVADHFQYLASMGPMALAGAGLTRSAEILFSEKLWLPSRLGAGLVMLLIILTWQRAWVYENQETLWTDTVNKNPNSQVARNNLGAALLEEGELDKARAELEKAIALNPKDAGAHDNLGKVLAQQKRLDEAMLEFQKARDLNPNDAEARYNLGSLLAQQGRTDEAMANFQSALKIDPNNLEAHYNLASLLLQKGEKNEAILEYQATLEINPNLAEAWNGLGVALLKSGRTDDAIPQLQKAIELNPALADAHGNLGAALLQKGRIEDAIAQFQEVVRLKPDSVAAQQILARVQALARQPHAKP